MPGHDGAPPGEPRPRSGAALPVTLQNGGNRRQRRAGEVSGGDRPTVPSGGRACAAFPAAVT